MPPSWHSTVQAKTEDPDEVDKENPGEEVDLVATTSLVARADQDSGGWPLATCAVGVVVLAE